MSLTSGIMVATKGMLSTIDDKIAPKRRARSDSAHESSLAIFTIPVNTAWDRVQGDRVKKFVTKG